MNAQFGNRIKDQAREIILKPCEHSLADRQTVPCDPCALERVMVILGQRNILFNALANLCEATRVQDMDWWSANRLLRDLESAIRSA